MVEWIATLPIIVQNAIAAVAFVPILLLATAATLFVFGALAASSTKSFMKVVAVGVTSFSYSGFVIAPFVIHGIIARPLSEHDSFSWLYAPSVALWTALSFLPIYAYSVIENDKNGLLGKSLRIGANGFFSGALLASLILLIVKVVPGSNMESGRTLFFAVPLIGFWVPFLVGMISLFFNLKSYIEPIRSKSTKYKLSSAALYVIVFAVSFI